MRKKVLIEWTDKEIKMARDESLSHREVAEVIGRTYAAVKKKRQDLGIKNTKQDIAYYSQEELALIANNSHMSNEELAKKLGRTTQAISLKRQKAGLTAPSDEWTDDEKDYLVEMYLSMSKAEIATSLGRSVSAVMTKANVLGITKKVDYWTKEEMAILIANFDMSNELISKLLTTKTEGQISYKKAYLNTQKRKNNNDLKSALDSDVPYDYKGRSSQYADMLSVMEVGQSFEFPAKEYQTLMMAKKLFPDRVFRSRSVDQTTMRLWRLN